MYPTIMVTMNQINHVFKEGNTTPGHGVPYAPLAWDPLHVPQPVELAGTAPLPYPDLPSFATKLIYLEDFSELPCTFDELHTAFSAL